MLSSGLGFSREDRLLNIKRIGYDSTLFEFSNFENGTKLIADSVYKATLSGAFSLVGGGDSVAAIKKFKKEKGISYLSTGGGAMLKYIEGCKLPTIESLKKKWEI